MTGCPFGLPSIFCHNSKSIYGLSPRNSFHSGMKSSLTAPPADFNTGKEYMVSIWLNDWCCTHDGHRPQESPLLRLVQCMYWAAARAMANFPIPGGPSIIIACGSRSLSAIARRRSLVGSWPGMSANFMGNRSCEGRRHLSMPLFHWILERGISAIGSKPLTIAKIVRPAGEWMRSLPLMLRR